MEMLGIFGEKIKNGPHINQKSGWIDVKTQSSGGTERYENVLSKIERAFLQKGNCTETPHANSQSQFITRTYKDGSTLTYGRQGSGGAKIQFQDVAKLISEKITFID